LCERTNERERHQTTSHLQLCAKRDQYPICLVWSPIPPITWLLPFVGHIGIANSEGLIHDFAGSHFINKSRSKTAFGRICKYIPINLDDINMNSHSEAAIRPNSFSTDEEYRNAWDTAINEASEKFEHLSHNLFLNNCHHHVAVALNRLKYLDFERWNTTTLILYLVWRGRYPSLWRFLELYAGVFVDKM